MGHYLMIKWFPNRNLAITSVMRSLSLAHTSMYRRKKRNKITREVPPNPLNINSCTFLTSWKNIKCVVCQESMRIMGNQCMTTSLFSS